MQTLSAPQRATTERHKPGAVLSRKERQGQAMAHDSKPATPFFAPTPTTIQAKCDTCQEEEKPAVQTKAAESQPAQIQAKCADCEQEAVQRNEEETPDVQQVADATPAPANPSPSDFLGGLTVGKPNDRFEREADQMGEQISRMPANGLSGLGFSSAITPLQRNEDDEADVQAKLLPAAPSLQRKADGGLQTSGQFTGRVQTSAGGGAALPVPLQKEMGSAFQADFSGVRIHTDTRAAQLSNDIGAKAFTYRNDIYFNENQYDTTSSDGRFLLAHELTHTVQQEAAVKRSVQPAVTAPSIQASWLDEAIDWLLSNFNPDVIPGYSLLSVIVNYDVLRRRRVEMTPENLVKGLLELIPVFGMLLFNLLQEHQVITKAFNWVRGELQRLNLTTDRLKSTVEAAWEEIHLVDGLEANFEVVKKHFIALKNDVVSFAESVKDELLSMLKEALVSVLKGLAVDKIPAYPLFTKIIQYDPITGQEVSAPLEEILSDFLDLIGRKQEREEMEKRGTIKKTADWLRSKLGQFLGLLTQLKTLVSHLWETFSFETLRDPIGKLNGLVAEAKGFVQNVWDFASEVALTVLQFIKDALLGLLRTHAHGIRGYKLLTVILEKDPVTDTPVERNAISLIGGFIELVAGPEKFAEIQQSGAIEKMIAWLETQIEKFQITWAGIKKLFTDIWNSLHIEDLINPIAAFIRVVGQFEEPIGRVLGFIIEVVKKVIYTALELMNFPFDLIDQIVAKAMQAYEDIKRDPMAFLGNLLKAVKLGFSQFFGNIGTHLLNGLVGWLTSELKQANIQPPKDFTFRSVLTFVLDVLGISMEKIWKKIGEHPKIGPQKVAKIRGMLDRLTGIWSFVKEVMEEGPGAIWKHIQDQLANLWDMVLDKVKSWIMEQIIDKMVTKLLSMLDPTGIMAVINSFIAFYRAVQSFIERLREILEVVSSFVGGVAEIARGVVTTGANFLERTMANALPTIIGFLANQVGLRGLGSRINEMIQSVQALVDKGLTWLVNKAVELGGQLLEMGRDAVAGVLSFFGLRTTFTAENGENHALYFEESGGQPVLMMASDPKSIREFLDFYAHEYSITATSPEGLLIAEIRTFLTSNIQPRIQQMQAAKRSGNTALEQTKQRELLDQNVTLSGKLRRLMAGNRAVGRIVESYNLEGLTGTYNSIPNPTSDELTPDHQPQAAILVWAAEQPYFGSTSNMARRAAGRAANGYAINLHRIRHEAGRTYGTNGDVTKNSFISRARAAIAGLTGNQAKRDAVVNLMKPELAADVRAIKNVAGRNKTNAVWSDIQAIAMPQTEKDALVTRVKGNIERGENQIASQDMDSLKN
ncbi:eCIS core domain-containing protein [Spirosoma areae]